MGLPKNGGHHSQQRPLATARSLSGKHPNKRKAHSRDHVVQDNTQWQRGQRPPRDLPAHPLLAQHPVTHGPDNWPVGILELSRLAQSDPSLQCEIRTSDRSQSVLGTGVRGPGKYGLVWPFLPQGCPREPSRKVRNNINVQRSTDKESGATESQH